MSGNDRLEIFCCLAFAAFIIIALLAAFGM